MVLLFLGILCMIATVALCTSGLYQAEKYIKDSTNSKAKNSTVMLVGGGVVCFFVGIMCIIFGCKCKRSSSNDD